MKDKAIYAEYDPEFYYSVKLAALRRGINLKQFVREALENQIKNETTTDGR